MTPIARWLAAMGLEEYSSAFIASGIGMDVLQDLTEADLESIGIRLGDRKRIMRAIRGQSAVSLGLRESAQADSAPPVLAETQPWRRQLTVLVCDLVASTALAAQQDPEDFRQVIRSFQDTCAGVIIRAGGYVARFMGDGIMAYFGYPQAYEHSAESAARCGLELVVQVAGLRRPDGERLHVRVGIATGIVIGESVGEDASRQTEVVGETPNLAARLQQVAREDNVYVSDSTHRLLGQGFICGNRGLHPLKGLSGERQVWQVLGETVIGTRFEAHRTGRLTTLVGRDHELHQLRDVWGKARVGRGRAALMCGEAGIGKSRICHELVKEMSPDSHFLIQLQCSPQHTSSAFYSLINYLEHTAALKAEDSPERKLDKLQSVLGVAGADRLADMPLFAALLSIPAPGRLPDIELTPRQLKDRIINAVIRHMLDLSRLRPLICIFEDVHWIDASTLELLRHAVDCIPQHAVMMLVTFRPEFYPLLLDREHVSLLRVNRVRSKEVVDVIMDVTGGRDLPRDIVDQIIAKSDGVPVFIEELTKAVLESGMLREEEGRFVVNGASRSVDIPSTLQDSLMSRLDRLAASREIAQIGAAIGREFSYRLLAAVTSRAQNDLATGLAQLTAAELIFSRGVPPDASYIFKHALVQDAAYESLLRSHRQVLHGRIADVVCSHFPELAETQPELVAHHLASSGRNKEAVACLIKAGERAIERAAITEAIELLKRALELHPTGRGSREDRRLSLQLELMLARALFPSRGYASAETRGALLRAKSLIDNGTPTADRLTVLFGIWSSYYVGGDVAQQLKSGAGLMAEAARDGEPTSSCIANRSLGTTYLALGNFAMAHQYLARAQSLYDPNAPRKVRFYFGQEVGIAVLSFLCLVLWHLGRLGEADEVAREAISRAKALSHPFSLFFTLAHASGMMGMLRRDPAEVLSHSDLVIRLAEEHGLPFWVAGGQIGHGWALAKSGDCAKGITEMAGGIGQWRQTGARLWVPFFLTRQAETLTQCDRFDEALMKLDEANTIAEETGELWAVPELLRVKSSVLQLMSGRREDKEVEALLRSSIDLSRNQGALSWRLRASCDLAWLLRERGRGDEGLKLLNEAYGAFGKQFDEPDHRAARRLMNEMATGVIVPEETLRRRAN